MKMSTPALFCNKWQRNNMARDADPGNQVGRETQLQEVLIFVAVETI